MPDDHDNTLHLFGLPIRVLPYAPEGEMVAATFDERGEVLDCVKVKLGQEEHDDG